MANASYLELKREANVSNVHVLPGRYDDSIPNNVPTVHREKFFEIQSLGSRHFDNDGSLSAVVPTAGPWPRERRWTAASIHRRAEKCRSENRNESGWRAEIENRIFQRFDIQVTW
jgi:hypothetical protein